MEYYPFVRFFFIQLNLFSIDQQNEIVHKSNSAKKNVIESLSRCNNFNNLIFIWFYGCGIIFWTLKATEAESIRWDEMKQQKKKRDTEMFMWEKLQNVRDQHWPEHKTYETNHSQCLIQHSQPKAGVCHLHRLFRVNSIFICIQGGLGIRNQLSNL